MELSNLALFQLTTLQPTTLQDVDYEDVAKFGEESDGETVEKRDGENSQIEKTSGLQPIYLVHFQNWGHRNDRYFTCVLCTGNKICLHVL